MNRLTLVLIVSATPLLMGGLCAPRVVLQQREHWDQAHGKLLRKITRGSLRVVWKSYYGHHWRLRLARDVEIGGVPAKRGTMVELKSGHVFTATLSREATFGAHTCPAGGRVFFNDDRSLRRCLPPADGDK